MLKYKNKHAFEQNLCQIIVIKEDGKVDRLELSRWRNSILIFLRHYGQN